mmetsp:Transcript_108518/g.338257  ORF Transcript_108518/g.338257 Transcript_108518/m.338257 type:complete len:492 (-) Transcript_108518:528-2003(-)
MPVPGQLLAQRVVAIAVVHGAVGPLVHLLGSDGHALDHLPGQLQERLGFVDLGDARSADAARVGVGVLATGAAGVAVLAVLAGRTMQELPLEANPVAQRGSAEQRRAVEQRPDSEVLEPQEDGQTDSIRRDVLADGEHAQLHAVKDACVHDEQADQECCAEPKLLRRTSNTKHQACKCRAPSVRDPRGSNCQQEAAEHAKQPHQHRAPTNAPAEPPRHGHEVGVAAEGYGREAHHHRRGRQDPQELHIEGVGQEAGGPESSHHAGGGILEDAGQDVLDLVPELRLVPEHLQQDLQHRAPPAQKVEQEGEEVANSDRSVRQRRSERQDDAPSAEQTREQSGDGRGQDLCTLRGGLLCGHGLHPLGLSVQLPPVVRHHLQEGAVASPTPPLRSQVKVPLHDAVDGPVYHGVPSHILIVLAHVPDHAIQSEVLHDLGHVELRHVLGIAADMLRQLCGLVGYAHKWKSDAHDADKKQSHQADQGHQVVIRQQATV